LYKKEEIIRKVSVAYEQAKSEMETYEDQISYFKDKLKESEHIQSKNIIEENQNLKEQNKQLLITIIDNLTKSRSRSQSKSKRK